ncbi:MAG: hypothetical protein AAGD17_11685 [Bacteroidota bacterium]
MKKLLLLVLSFSIFACNQNNNRTITETPIPEPMDIEAEMASIEATRIGFQKAIKEKRYGDLRNFGTQDIITLTPVCGDWAEYKRQRENPNKLFSYDSLVMSPIETVILNDTMAYDLGTSVVYYTNDKGEAVEIKDTFLAIVKKDKNDGQWKLFREVATTNTLK